MSTHFTYKGLDFTMEIADDPDHDPPWNDGDGRGIVSDWRRKDTKRPGERVLMTDDRGRSCLFFDWQGTMAKATKEGWGLSDDEKVKLAKKLKKPHDSLTRGEVIEAAVTREFDLLCGWCNNEWTYIGIVVTFVDNDSGKTYEQSCWGIESNADSYIEEVRNDLADECIPYSRFEMEMRRAAG